MAARSTLGLMVLLLAPCVGCRSQPSAIDAIWEGDVALLGALDRGADVNASDDAGYAVIHHAAIRGDVTAIDALLARHATVDALNAKHETALFLAAALGKTECVHALLAGGANASVQIPPSMTTSLIEASRSGPIEIVQLLLEGGADPNARNTWGETAFHAAAKSDALRAEAVAKLLVAHGASFDVRDARGYTPLHVAASNGNLGIVRLYHESGRDLSPATVLGQTPIDVAVETQSVYVEDLLHRLGGKASDPKYAPVVFRKARVDDAEAVERLLSLGADPADTSNGQTLLVAAREAGARNVEAIVARSRKAN